MNKNLASLPMRILVTLTFVLMVFVNGLANALPINGRQTGEVSDSYPNLFAPAGLTFAIWGLIYLLLALHVLYQWGLFHQTGRQHSALLGRVGLLFSLSSLANTAWVFAWHYDLIGLSTLLIVSILVLLILINRTLGAMKPTKVERLLVTVPFSIYFGWITVATVANLTVWLVSINWSGFGLAESIWAAMIIAIAAAIGAFTMLKGRDIAYGSVLIWAFIGILTKHTSDTGFAGVHSDVILTTIICLAVFLAAEVFLVLRNRRIGT
jgi:hypothetical protein